jgi:hypothetical protein
MSQFIKQEEYDVVVIGAGAAGVAAAVAAARNGARTIMVDAGPMIGGEMISGIPIDGCVSTAGEWVVGGVIREIFAECDRLGGYIGVVNDFRSLHVIACDPEIMKIAILNYVKKAGVKLLLYTFAENVVVQRGRVEGVIVLNKNQRTLLRAKVVIDCSGDGDIAVAAGAAFEKGDEAAGDLQPVTMVFRMMGIDTPRLLDFVKAHPENFGLAEHVDKRMTVEQAAEGLHRQGLAKVFMVSNGPLMRDAIARGELYQSSMIAVTPVSLARREVSLNTTRLGYLDATNTDKLSAALPDLTEQVWICAEFMKKNVPGFENAVYSGIAPRIGIRETRRIIGDVVLSGDDIMQARKRDDGIGKGAHELDIHLAGTGHVRSTIKDGGSYDIPFGCLLPKGLANLMVAGRNFSSTREAHSSARVMGTCMAMGQATGTAAALCASSNAWGGDVRELAVGRLRDVLRSQGAVLDGTL